MQHATAFTHPGRGDDHERPAQIVEGFRLVHIPYIGEQLKAERIAVVGQKYAGFLVVELRVLAEYFGDVHGQGAVDKNREFGDGIGLDQFVQYQHQLLGSSYGKEQYVNAKLE